MFRQTSFTSILKEFGLHGDVVVHTVVSQQEGSRLEPFCVEFACSPCVCVASLWHVRLIGDAKFKLVVSVSWIKQL